MKLLTALILPLLLASSCQALTKDKTALYKKYP